MRVIKCSPLRHCGSNLFVIEVEAGLKHGVIELHLSYNNNSVTLYRWAHDLQLFDTRVHEDRNKVIIKG